MEWIDGPTLVSVVAKNYELPIWYRVCLLYDIAVAMTYFHSLPNIPIHRDIHSGNILLTKSPGSVAEDQLHECRIKIIDFEHACAYDPKGLKDRDPSFSSPPQVLSGLYDQRYDIY